MYPRGSTTVTRGLAPPQQPLKPPRGVHPDVTATHDQDLHDELLPLLLTPYDSGTRSIETGRIVMTPEGGFTEIREKVASR